MEFLASLKDGKWFFVRGKYGGKYAVKMGKSKHDDEGIHSVWLSVNDPEAMAVEDYSGRDWTYINDVFENQGAGVFHFGSYEASDDYSIYDEQGNVIVEKLVKAVVENVEKGFVTKEEVLYMWERLNEGDIDLPELKVKS